MKRELKPFVVEVKRGKRRSPFGARVEMLNAKPSEASRRADLALFAASSSEPVLSKSLATEALGRILPSLIEVTPEPDVVRDEIAPRRRGRKPGSKNKPKALDGVGLAAASEITPPGATEAEGTAAASAVEPPASRQPAFERPPATRVRLRERSSILARYVFGTEPVPGERWKRASRKVARAGKYSISH